MSAEKPEIPASASNNAESVSRKKAFWWDFAVQMMVTTIVTLIVLALSFGALLLFDSSLPDSQAGYLDVVVAAYLMSTALLLVLSTAVSYVALCIAFKRVRLPLIHLVLAVVCMVIAIAFAYSSAAMRPDLAIFCGIAVTFSVAAAWLSYFIRSRMQVSSVFSPACGE